MLGLELCETSVIAVAVDEGGRLAARAEAPIGALAADHGGESLDPSLAACALRLLAEIGGAAAAAGGALGIAAIAPDAPAARHLVQTLAGRFGGPFVHQGALASGGAAAIAEAAWGAGRGARDVAYFAVSDRAIAGIVRDLEPWRGAHGRAPAIGWLALNPVEREDYRKTGCLEAEVAAIGIVRRLIWRIKAGDRSRVQDMANGDLGAITAGLVLDAARDRDGVAISVMRDTAKYLGMAAANLVAIAVPDALVLGGIMASAADLLFDPVRVELTRRLPPSIVGTLRVSPAQFGPEAAAMGAARLAMAAVQ